MRNPKMEGTLLIDAVPQEGKCPHGCRACYFNAGFYRDTPFVPTKEEAQGCVVRVNSGNDSNNQRDLVLARTVHLQHKYYCTSVPTFGFGAPVQFTCNPNELESPFLVPASCANELHSVRFRYAPWNEKHLRLAVSHYAKALRVPVIITPMRYYAEDDIPKQYRCLYTHKTHILTVTWQLKNESGLRWDTRRWGGAAESRLVFACSGRCADCLMCYHLYRQMVEESRG